MKSAKTETLRTLLQDMRNGFSVISPVLIRVNQNVESLDEYSSDKTITTNIEMDWAKEYTQEYADEVYFFLGSNRLSDSLEEKVILGRAKQCHVRLNNEAVSKIHATIAFVRAKGGYFITDCQSRNGTFVNGVRIRPMVGVQLMSGTYVGLSESVFVFMDPPTLRKIASSNP